MASGHVLSAKEARNYAPNPEHRRRMPSAQLLSAKWSLLAKPEGYELRTIISRKALPIPGRHGCKHMSTRNQTNSQQDAPKAEAVAIRIAAVIVVIVAHHLILKIPALSTPWSQGYDPTGHWLLSTLIAALPVVVLLGSLAFGHVKAHYAALLGLATALVVAIFGFHMPARMAAATAVYGAAYGLFPIGWIVLNVIFMYQLTVESGRFKVLQHSMTGITQDRRLQLLLIAFCFGAFFEGASGFGTPVAVTAALLIGLRLPAAAGFGLIADRQHRAGGLRRFGNSDHRAGQSDRLQRNHPGRDGRPHSDTVLCPGALLADLRLCWLVSNVGNLAGHSGRRCFLRDSAVLHVQLPRSVAGQHWRIDHFHGMPDRLPVRLASQEESGPSKAKKRRPSTAPVTAIAARK